MASMSQDELVSFSQEEMGTWLLAGDAGSSPP